MEKKAGKPIQKLMAVPCILLTAFMLLVIGSGFLHPDSYGELRGVWGPLRTVATLAAGILFYGIALYGAESFGARLSEKAKRILLAAAVVIAVSLQLFLVIRYPLQIWWDNTSVLSSAISIVDGKPEFFDEIYFNQLGHQNCFLFLTVLLTYLARLAGIADAYLTLAFSLFDVLALDAAMAFFLLLIKRIRSKKAAIRVLLLLLTCPGMYLWCGYYYTTNVSLLFMSLYFYLLSLMWEKKRSIPFYLGLGMLTVFGCQFRATMLICVVAGVLFAIFRRPKALLKAAAFLLLGGVLMLGILRFSYQKMIPEYDEDSRFPVTHWLMMSAQGNGEYNDADLAFTSSFETKEEKAQATKEEYIRRLKEMGPKGIAALAVRKTINNWSYGNHSYYPLFHRYDWLTDVLWTPDHQVMFYLEQVWHLSILLLVLLGTLSQMASLWKERKEDAAKDWEWFLQVALLGGFCFYLLWETFPYYSVGFLGVLCALCPEGMKLIRKSAGDRAEQSTTDGKNATKRSIVVGCAAVLSAAAMIGSLASSQWPQSVTPVVTQKKFNQMYEMGNCESLSQSFEADRSFDTVRFWISKRDLGQSAGGEYEISIVGDERGEVFCRSYSTEGLSRVDEVIETFPVVSVKTPERFTLTIKQISGGQENPLSVGAYKNPDDPYLMGSFYADGAQLEEEMFFTVTCGGADDVIRLYE